MGETSPKRVWAAARSRRRRELTPTNAAAHHGWNWAEEEQTELEGTIREIYIGPPHPELRVEVGDGVMWRIELGNPRLTAASGFVEGVGVG